MTEHTYTIEYLKDVIKNEKKGLEYSKKAFESAEKGLNEHGGRIRSRSKHIIELEETLFFLESQNNNRR